MQENILTNKPRLTEKELAEYWGMKLCTLRKWRTLCISPIYIKIGSRIFYTRESIEEYERNRMFRGSSDRVMPEEQGGSYDIK